MAASAVLSSSFPLTRNHHRLHLSSGPLLKPMDQCFGSEGITNLSFILNHVGKMKPCTSRRTLTVHAAYGEGGRPNNGSIFVGGFILGGLIVGTLGSVYAPKIGKALTGADRKDLMRKLPKFIYDEDKALEKTRRILTEKIAQLNSAIDDVSTQLRSEDEPDELVVNSDEVGATI